MFSSVFLFLNIGTPELMLIMFVALLLFGGDKLPGIARGLGKGIRDFKDASEGVKREINNQINSYEEKKPEPPVAIAETTTEVVPEIRPMETAVPVADHAVTYPLPDHEAHTTPAENHTEVKNVTPGGIDLTKTTHE